MFIIQYKMNLFVLILIILTFESTLGSIHERFLNSHLFSLQIFNFNSLFPSNSKFFNLRKIAKATSLKSYIKQSNPEKLATTPVYFICNSRGSAYLQEDVQGSNPNQRVLTYFMSYEDAGNLLSEMTQANGNANEFRVMAIGMEKVLNQMISKKQSRKYGRSEIDIVYRIQPSTIQLNNAAKLLSKNKVGIKSMRGMNIPMFSVKGLTVKRSNGEVVTPYYFAYEDLKDDWDNLLSQNLPSIPKIPDIYVRDFTEVLSLSSGISKPQLQKQDFSTIIKAALNKSGKNEFSQLTNDQRIEAIRNLGIVPPKREIDVIKDFYRHGIAFNDDAYKSRIIN